MTSPFRLKSLPLLLVSAAGLAAVASSQGQKLNGPLARPLGGDIYQHEVSPDGARAVYLADQRIDGVLELFANKPGSGAPPVLLAAPAVAGGRIWDFQIGAQSQNVVFRGSVDTAGVDELYQVPLLGGPVVKLSGPMQPNGDVYGAPGSVQIDAAETRVFYIADQDSDNVRELYSVPIGGGPAVKLNAPLGAGSQRVYSFLISPDGSRVVFLANPDPSVAELFSVPAGGGPITRLSPPGQLVNQGYQIDPTGTHVVFTAIASGVNRRQLYVRPLDGSGSALPLLPDSSAQTEIFAFTPDGQRVICKTNVLDPSQVALLSVSLSGSGFLVLDSLPSTFLGLRLTPDGATAVYQVYESNLPKLRRVPVDGSTAAADIGPGDGALIDFTPDSQRVLYRGSGLMSARLDLSEPPVTISTDSVFRLEVAPGGQRVVFVSQPSLVAGATPEIYSAPVTGTKAPLKLNPPLVFDGGVENSAALAFHVTPQGRVLYVADQVEPTRFELYSVPVSGGTALRVSGDMPSGPIVGDIWRHEVTPDGEFAVFLADDLVDDRFELFSARTSGRTPPTRLHGTLADAEHISQFALSPDGATVVYVLTDRVARTEELRSVPTAGGSSILLHGPASMTVLAIAIDPQNATVAFGAYQAGGFLASVPIDGSAPATILDGAAPAYSILPTQDGRAVYRLYSLTGLDTDLLRSVPLDGSSAPVVLSGGRRVASAQLAPDGVHVAFLGGVPQELFLVPTDGSSAPVRLNPALQTVAHVSRFQTVGSFAYYTANQDDLNASELYRVPLDGSATAVKLNGPLVNRGSVANFDLTPDGMRVVYHADQDEDERWELYSAPSDGSGPVVKLNPPLTVGDVRGTNFFDDFFDRVFAISPDGNHVAFRTDATRRDQIDLWVAPTDGSTPAVRVSRPGDFRDTVLGEYRFAGDQVAFLVVEGWLAGGNRVALYRAPLDGQRPARRASGLGSLASIPRHSFPSVFSILPGGARAVVQIDGDTQSVVELFSVSLTRPTEAAPSPTRSVVRGL